jgi:hypothetical protein
LFVHSNSLPSNVNNNKNKEGIWHGNQWKMNTFS